MAKKLTPGKGGAKGMHHGHAYKETCGCIICKSKRKKENTSVSDNVVRNITALNEPVFERKDTPHEYVAVITYKGIAEDNYTGSFDSEKGEIVFVVDGKYKKVFDCKDHDVNMPERRGIISTIEGDVLTVLIPKKQTPLTTETVNEFPHEEEKPIERTEEKTEQPVEPSLRGEIVITPQTFDVMNLTGVKLAKRFNLQRGFDHNKFMNELVNAAVIHFCKSL